ncbi:MAG TPA: ABC transporter substrate-binding protein [Candidatus Nanopelagicales bacterium]|nr:ABC transporter substrate-binding protein [Candidatus Nanopelagicales bacterium]
MRRSPLALIPVAAALLLAACGSSSATTPTATGAGSGSASASCSPQSLQTLTPGKLTVATGTPAFSPWVIDDKPETGKGFEAAVAYAVAKKLGYTDADVTWVRTGFDEAIAPGPKKFDVNLQQFTITEDRKKAVDFSSGYYDLTQAVVTYKGSPIENAKSLADLKGAKLGAAVGTTSLDAINASIQPTTAAKVYNTNDDAVAALKAKQIDGLVVDLPTAFYIAFGELDNGVLIGQLPNSADTKEQLGFLLAKGSPLTQCVTQAVDSLRADGTLAKLQDQWLAASAGAPVLS